MMFKEDFAKGEPQEPEWPVWFKVLGGPYVVILPTDLNAPVHSMRYVVLPQPKK